MPDRALDLICLAVLTCIAITALSRTIRLARRGVWVLPIDRERSLGQALADLAFLIGVLVWCWEAVAAIVAPAWRLGPDSLRHLDLQWWALRWTGAAVALGGVALYVRAMLDMGASWRFTIDRSRAGTLVTSGVFARSRNPIYLALALVALGIALAVGSALAILLACAAPPYLHVLVLREERFLSAHYGEPYEQYCARAPRWMGRPRA